MATANDIVPVRPALQGIGLFVLAIALLAVMDVLIKWLSAGYSTPQILFFRSLFGLVPLGWLVWRGGMKVLRAHRPAALAARGLIHAGAAFSFFYALRFLPLADAYAIAFTAPLFLTALSGPLLGERVGVRRWSAVIVGFLGVLVMLRPGGDAGGVHWLGSAAALTGALCYAVMHAYTRKLSRTESNGAIVLYATATITLASGLTLPFAFVLPTPGDFALLVLVGLIAGIGMLMMTHALRVAPVSVLAPFEYTVMIWGVLYGAVVFGDMPDEWLFIGGAVVVASNLYILHREARRPKAASPVRPTADGASPPQD